MKSDIVRTLTATFEGHAQQTDGGVEYWLARDVQHLLGYAEWRNFEGVVKRAAGIIKHKHASGSIKKTTATVVIGSGTTRKIADYMVDKPAMELIQELASSHKLTNVFSIRNESVVLQLVEKYCRLNKIQFAYQFRLQEFVFDCLVGRQFLIEFDEPHHFSQSRQRIIDMEKNKIAESNHYQIIRVTLDMDIVDIIFFLEEQVRSK